ncbi:hypothetical protein O0I10_001577 [Lichtheimia ornata]|uniref:Phosphatidic acid phosphatase type 2/haloperoxidase domain-containing protein n=1 Tax=Lichtheimia ornata TaxID=688661 RepID=A0AAD7Y1D7_9FUNG|nr:uncharacterized protein O0I10_001577 [Lichtheimia ornata]KAJ8662615.1 hypothetical protein O0I10_001577 [Lichtheimia ornata]
MSSLQVDWKSPITRRIIRSYIPDWVLVVVMAAVFLGVDNITPFRREFSLEDKTIMFTHSARDSVPMWLVAIICCIIPIIIIAIISLGLRRSLVDCHSGILGLCVSLSLCAMLTTVIKVSVGRPRPDFIDRCQPPAGSSDPEFGLSNYTICTTPADTHDMIDGFKSFPSGHSSFSFAGLSYLAFYLAGKMQMFADELGRTYKGFLFSFPIIGSLLVAISRTEDYRHHWQDVFIGSLLGLGCAYFAYRQYYPALGRVTCATPFKARLDGFKGRATNLQVPDGPLQQPNYGANNELPMVDQPLQTVNVDGGDYITQHNVR